MRNLSKKKQKAKREIAKIKAELMAENPVCFFSGETYNLIAFHICPIGTHEEHETNPRNIVLSLPEWNDVWVDRGTAKQVIKIPNVAKGFARMFEIDQLYFNQKLRMMEENLSKDQYDEFIDKVQIELLELDINK